MANQAFIIRCESKVIEADDAATEAAYFGPFGMIG